MSHQRSRRQLGGDADSHHTQQPFRHNESPFLPLFHDVLPVVSEQPEHEGLIGRRHHQLAQHSINRLEEQLNAQHGQKRQLETNIPQAERIGHQHDNGSQREGVQRERLAMKQLYGGIDRQHRGGPHHRGRAPHHQGKEPDDGQHGHLSQQSPTGAEEDEGEKEIDDAQMQPRKSQHVGSSADAIFIAQLA